MNFSKDPGLRKLLMTGMAVAGAAGALAISSRGGEKPIDDSVVSAFVTETTKDIAKIPVTADEVTAVRQQVNKKFDGEEAVVKIDEATGQPYHETQIGPQVVRLVAARNGKGTYEFVINTGFDSQGNLDHSQASFLDTTRLAADRTDNLSIGLYDLDAPPLVQRSTLPEAQWGGSVTADGLTQSELDTATSATTRGRLVMTPERFDEIRLFISETVDLATSHAPIERQGNFPDSLVHNP